MTHKPTPNRWKRIPVTMPLKNHRKIKIYASTLSLTYTQLINQMLNKAIDELEKEKFSEEFVCNVNNSTIDESPLIS